ncbi:MAG: fatty acid--CoA ligase family protein [Pseudomonadota bacterium]
MRGYLDAPDLTEAALADGYFRTGDQARLREDGTVEITGRLSDMVNRAGNKIAPLEIERVFSQHPDVVDALATGLPDKETGEALHIAVLAKPNSTLDAQTLRSWAAVQMDRHKLPDRIHLVTALPTGNTGKADRNALRHQLMSTGGGDTL